METKVVRAIQKSPIKQSPEGGVDIGTVYAGTILVVEISKESPHDGMYHIVGPNPPINPDGTYLRTNKQGWIEVAHVVDANKKKSNVVIEIDWEEQTWSAREG